MEAARAEVTRLEGETQRLGEARLDLIGRVGNAAGREQELAANLEQDTERRSRSATAFQRFAATGLLATAQPGLDLPDLSAPWAPDPTVRLARRVEQALAEVESDDPAWDRVQRELTHGFKELADALSRYGHEATADLAEDRCVVAVAFQGQRRTPGELVSQMNAELEERPTSTGMRLRFRWEPLPDGPPGLAEARRRLLRQASDAWSVEDRAAVSAFLQEQIAAERARDDSGTWLEHLTAALDYRAWHRFAIQRWQDGHWRSAAAPASSGERVLTVTLPLFAAASAHYRSAQPAAPRLVLLDEAFAGVDDDARAKYMGLLATFDLDFVMTSEREWGCYPTVLLRQLGAAGARLHYHGDFDWPGITIANGIVARFGALAWRLDGGAYRSAAAAGGPPLRGSPVTATWDPTLTQTMLELGVKVEKERVLDDLLADLAEP